MKESGLYFIKLFHKIGAENLEFEVFTDGINRPFVHCIVLWFCTSTVKSNKLHKSSGRFLLGNSKIRCK